jgi:Tat protein translocase TatB subunit
MLDIGLSELLIIMAVALIVLGPKKLPEVARSLGRGLAQFRRASEDLRRSILVEDELLEREKSSEALPYSSAYRRSDPPVDDAEEASEPDHDQTGAEATLPASDLPPEKNGIDG